ncbi:hypothetical protein [Gaiella sp.]|uniref:hypothetical protein n=1 Tax=Gaiella sp. TaxID=2663207 RepID=UPI003983691D
MRPLIATLAAAVATFALAGQSAGAAAACRPSGSHTLVANADARLYTTRTGALGGCAIAQPQSIVLAFAETFYRPPVMALSGTMAAMVVNDPNFDFPYIRAIDLGPSDYQLQLRRPEEQIGSIRVRRDGTLAFISCPPGRYDSANPPVTPGPTCRHSGRWRDTVYIAVPHRGLRRIANSRQLDPASLQLSDTTISWRQSGHRRRILYRSR